MNELCIFQRKHNCFKIKSLLQKHLQLTVFFPHDYSLIYVHLEVSNSVEYRNQKYVYVREIGNISEDYLSIYSFPSRIRCGVCPPIISKSSFMWHNCCHYRSEVRPVNCNWVNHRLFLIKNKYISSSFLIFWIGSLSSLNFWKKSLIFLIGKGSMYVIYI